MIFFKPQNKEKIYQKDAIEFAENNLPIFVSDELSLASFKYIKKARRLNIPTILLVSKIFNLAKKKNKFMRWINNLLFMRLIRYADLILVDDKQDKEKIDALNYDIVVRDERLSDDLIARLTNAYFIPPKKKLTGEIIRFLVVGVVATVVDYGIYSLMGWLAFGGLSDASSWIETAICTTLGFIAGVIVNYLLSVFWVYKDVEKSFQKKSAKTIIAFIVYSLIGLIIGILIMEGFNAIGLNCLQVDINHWMDGIFTNDWSFITFIWFTLFFGIKTLIVMIWNYLSRKILIFMPKIVSRINKNKFDSED